MNDTIPSKDTAWHATKEEVVCSSRPAIRRGCCLMVDIAVFELEIDLLLVALVWLCNRD